MEIKQIGNFQAIALILIIVINYLVLGTPRTLIAETGTGTILNMFYVFLVTIILVFIVTKLFNNFKGKDIVDISEFLGGKVLKFIVGIVYILYFLLILSTTVRIIVQDLEIIYFENVSISVLTLLIIASIVFVYKYGSSAIIKCNSIIAPNCWNYYFSYSFFKYSGLFFRQNFSYFRFWSKRNFYNWCF